jgi:hypothetical protein
VIGDLATAGPHIPPDRFEYSGWGLVIGIAAGLMVASFVWRPWWTVRVALFGIVASAVFAILLSRQFTSSATIQLGRGYPVAQRLLSDAGVNDYLRSASFQVPAYIEVLPSRSEVRISFTGTDRFATQKVVRDASITFWNM